MLVIDFCGRVVRVVEAVFISAAILFATPFSGRALAEEINSTGKTVNVIVIAFDPILKSHGNIKLHQHFKWSDPWQLTQKMIEDAKATSYGFVNYEVVEKIEYDGYTVLRSGYQ